MAVSVNGNEESGRRTSDRKDAWAMKETVLRELDQAIRTYDANAAEHWARKALEAQLDPVEVIVQGLTPAIQEVGKRFEQYECYLPQLVMAGDAMMAAVNILRKNMTSEQLESTRKGQIVIGTVKGDVHNIGKNIVGIMLTAAGYNVIDLGIDVEASKFVEEAERNRADFIAVSALMTFTARNMKTVTEYLEMEGVRNKYKVIFGGGPLNEKWAKEMGADGYAPDAVKAVTVVNQLMDR
jgi:corrinoid protein of di/trimethylamine methyltransferase